MKIRNGFVTNSSSSSFLLNYKIKLKNNECISYQETGCDGEGDPLVGELYVTKSPKELGASGTIEELVEKLKMSVSSAEYFEDGMNLFNKDDAYVKRITDSEEVRLDENYEDDYELPWEERCKRACMRALQFVEKVRQIESIECVKSIEISGNEYNYDEYFRTFLYDFETGEYTANIIGYPMEVDGSSGGDLFFIDEHEAKKIDGGE